MALEISPCHLFFFILKTIRKPLTLVAGDEQLIVGRLSYERNSCSLVRTGFLTGVEGLAEKVKGISFFFAFFWNDLIVKCGHHHHMDQKKNCVFHSDVDTREDAGIVSNQSGSVTCQFLWLHHR